MSPNGISSGFDEIFSTDSSDSEFLSQVDVKSRGNQINKQWEAIERTLYQEPGQQVTDPELLRECKLWRESFPHFRVKGTKIEVKAPENKFGEPEKNVQTLGNHFSLKTLEEKRESIKKKVVEVLVERLIAKFGSVKWESAKMGGDRPRGVHITQIDDETAQKLSNSSHGGLNQIKNSCHLPTPAGRAKESYFERGKAPNRQISSPEEGLTVEEVEKKLSDIFDSWTKTEKTATKLPDTAKSANSTKAANPPRGNSLLGGSLKSNAQRFKHRKFVPPLDSLSTMAKPFEMTIKIDKKYDGLIERIMERQQNKLVPKRQCRSSSCQGGHQEPLGRLRAASGLEDPSGGRSLPRLNKLSNPWLERSEADAWHGSAGDPVFGRGISKSSTGCGSVYSESMSQREVDERFVEELKREMALKCKRAAKKSGLMEEVNLRRPKGLTWRPEMSVKCSKMSVLGDSKRNKKGLKGGVEEGIAKGASTESGVRCNMPNAGRKGNKINGSKNFLPPFDTGIICTELTGRPKIGPRNPSKRY